MLAILLLCCGVELAQIQFGSNYSIVVTIFLEMTFLRIILLFLRLMN